ncbi:hypothetical protein ARMSODRAFT_983011 [Armillaria solidipes]|uniref:Uncharacterized protein n=1 Tax=Armillaria solidipes TaxID=1076256 RepID=A0A2H3B4J2_9AGAR|nr:hypothetical protein ARMSODRAFT_983011 [Armillaria solidipes]
MSSNAGAGASPGAAPTDSWSYTCRADIGTLEQRLLSKGKADGQFVFLGTKSLPSIPIAVTDLLNGFLRDPKIYLARTWSIPAPSAFALSELHAGERAFGIEGQKWYLREDVYKDWQDLEMALLRLREFSQSATTGFHPRTRLFSWPEPRRYGYAGGDANHTKLGWRIMNSWAAFILVMAEIAYNSACQPNFWEEVVYQRFGGLDGSGRRGLRPPTIQEWGQSLTGTPGCLFGRAVPSMIRARIPLWIIWGKCLSPGQAERGLESYRPTEREVREAEQWAFAPPPPPPRIAIERGVIIVTAVPKRRVPRHSGKGEFVMLHLAGSNGWLQVAYAVLQGGQNCADSREREFILTGPSRRVMQMATSGARYGPRIRLILSPACTRSTGWKKRNVGRKKAEGERRGQFTENISWIPKPTAWKGSGLDVAVGAPTTNLGINIGLLNVYGEFKCENQTEWRKSLKLCRDAPKVSEALETLSTAFLGRHILRHLKAQHTGRYNITYIWVFDTNALRYVEVMEGRSEDGTPQKVPQVLCQFEASLEMQKLECGHVLQALMDRDFESWTETLSRFKVHKHLLHGFGPEDIDNQHHSVDGQRVGTKSMLRRWHNLFLKLLALARSSPNTGALLARENARVLLMFWAPIRGVGLNPAKSSDDGLLTPAGILPECHQ